MDISRIFIQIVIALLCAGVASILVPRKIPGKLVGLILIGLAGVWVGEWGFALLYSRFGLNLPILLLSFKGVRLIPAIVGSTIVLYLVTLFLKWGKYN